MKQLAFWFMTLFFIAFQPASHAAAEYEAGVNYKVVSPAQPTANRAKVEVVELFWYGCPHCYQFEPAIGPWIKKLPADVQFVRIPAIFRPEWEIHARAFYAAEALGALDKLHPAMFEAMHELQQPLNSEEQIKALFMSKGVSEADFARTFRSFAVDSKIRRARDMTRRYGIDGVPSLVINGKYRTSADLNANSFTNLLKVADFLIDKERKAGKKSK